MSSAAERSEGEDLSEIQACKLSQSQITSKEEDLIMRQVPENPKYLLIGGGRLARHMAFFMKGHEVPFETWNRNDHSTADLVKKLKQSDLVLLCISDDQIQFFYEQFKNDHSLFIHFSGTFDHPEILGFHPLMTFGHELYDLETYKDIHIVGTKTEEEFRELFPQLPNQYHQIFSFQKSLYHSLCVLSGNGTTLLWDLVNKEFEKMGVPDEALAPYLKQISKNILENHQGRWTGPWYRGDQSTIEKNTQALDEKSLQALYIELARLSQETGDQNENNH